MKKITVFDFIAAISSIGVIAWVITDLFGGIIIYFFSYPILIFLILILYLISVIQTIVTLLKKGINHQKIKVISHSLVLLSITSINLFHSELFKSKRIMSATLKDDLYHYRLIFRENGTVENQIDGFMGYYKTKYGKYKIEKELIIFSKKPYDNNFIPDTLFLNKKQNAIFLNRNKKGEFEKEKQWLNHFKIEKN